MNSNQFADLLTDLNRWHLLVYLLFDILLAKNIILYIIRAGMLARVVVDEVKREMCEIVVCL